MVLGRDKLAGINRYAGFPAGLVGKEFACNAGDTDRCGFDAWVGKIPWRRKWPPTPAFLPGEFREQRSLAGYSPGGHRVRHNLATNTTLAFSEKQKRQNINKHVERD